MRYRVKSYILDPYTPEYKIELEIYERGKKYRAIYHKVLYLGFEKCNCDEYQYKGSCRHTKLAKRILKSALSHPLIIAGEMLESLKSYQEWGYEYE